MTALIIHHDGTVEECSDREFYSRIFGHAPRTKAEREAQYRADVERYVGFIDNGNEWAVPPPYLAECRRIIALREAAECGPDPLRSLEPRRAA